MMDMAALSDSYLLGFSNQASFGPPPLHPRSTSLPIFGLARSQLESSTASMATARVTATELHNSSSEMYGWSHGVYVHVLCSL